MLEAARLALCEVGVLGESAPMPPFTVRMSGNLVFLVYPHGPAFYLVKVGVQTDLRNDFEGFRAGHAAFPDGVPNPLALSQHRSFPTLVTTGVAFDPMGPALLRNPPPVLRRRLADFFATATREFRVEPQRMHSSAIRDAFVALGTAVDTQSWNSYLDAIGSAVDQLPAISQHGDFYADNLGMSSKALIVLDWEDFGRECIPGFDLALLLLSLNDFSVSRLLESIGREGAYEWIVTAGCIGCDLSPGLFTRLQPAYLTLLARMKIASGYGDAFAVRALRALHEALQLEQMREIAGSPA